MTDKTPCPTAQALQIDRIGLAGPVDRVNSVEPERPAYVNANGFAVPAASPAQAAQWISQRRS